MLAILPEKISEISEKEKQLYREFDQIISRKSPYNFGFPSDVAQSAYYPSDQQMNYHEINNANNILGSSREYSITKRIRQG